MPSLAREPSSDEVPTGTVGRLRKLLLCASMLQKPLHGERSSNAADSAAPIERAFPGRGRLAAWLGGTAGREGDRVKHNGSIVSRPLPRSSAARSTRQSVASSAAKNAVRSFVARVPLLFPVRDGRDCRLLAAIDLEVEVFRETFDQPESLRGMRHP